MATQQSQTVILSTITGHIIKAIRIFNEMKPNYAIMAERIVGDVKVVEVDTSKATYQGISWRTLGDFGKRKLENMLVLEQREKVKILYV